MNNALVLALLALFALGSVGCQGQTSTQPPIVPIRNMHEQPRYDAQEISRYFRDGRSMRPEVPHTVAQEMVVDPVIDTGVEDDGSYTLAIPETVVEDAGGMQALVERGRDRYGIYCVPCHDATGTGAGTVPERSGIATIRPPTYHDDRLRHVPDGQIYASIRNGIRNMPAHGYAIPVRDRWAIVAYVRALQLTQMETRSASAASPRREAGR